MTCFAELSSIQRDLLLKHLDLVLEKNQSTNLTRITSFNDALVLHIEDSLSALSDFNEIIEGPYGDLGSGAGYPGIPLAVATGRQTTLIDFRKKKTLVLNEIIHELGLNDQITTFAGRAELLAIKKPNTFAVVTARAVAKLPVIMELASPLLKTEGILICYKANLEFSELLSSKHVQAATGMYLIKKREFRLCNSYHRNIVIFQKKSSPIIKLPRKEGQAQRDPLGV